MLAATLGGNFMLLEAMQMKSLDQGNEDGKTFAIFKDVTSQAFPDDWYNFGHVGRAGRFCGAPLFPDFNGDGHLDFFYHNHYQRYPSTEWDVGMSMGYNNQSAGKPWFYNAGEKLIDFSEPYKHEAIDTHGTTILDIDRDGVLDMYISVGGGFGKKGGPAHNAVLMWGEKDNHQKKFVGGRPDSLKAGLENPDSRGRFTYFADFNSDGLLDVVFGNDVRVDNENVYGYMMLNDGKRHFTRDWGISEYGVSMILTDADGDGNANEFVIGRRACLPGEDEPTPQVAKFCESRPEGTSAIYRWNANKHKMELLDEETGKDRLWPEVAASFQSGDFDQDEKADLAVMRAYRIDLYLTSKRKAGSFPLGEPTHSIEWEPNDCMGHGMRVADFDLDGHLELLVMCDGYGKHRLYKKDNHGAFVQVKQHLGSLNDNSIPVVKETHISKACNHKSSQPKYVQTMCDKRAKKMSLPDVTANGMSVADWDNDGYLDVAMSYDWGNLVMLKNTWASANSWGPNKFIALKLKGTVSNEYGIGASVWLKASSMGDHGKETMVQLREVSSASHETDWWGSKDDRLIFGLGQHGIPEEIIVRWPGKGQQRQVIADKAMLTEHMNNMDSPLTVVEPTKN